MAADRDGKFISTPVEMSAFWPIPGGTIEVEIGRGGIGGAGPYKPSSYRDIWRGVFRIWRFRLTLAIEKRT